MTLDLSDCIFLGPALPPSFVRFELTDVLQTRGLLTDPHAKNFQRQWAVLRRQLTRQQLLPFLAKL